MTLYNMHDMIYILGILQTTTLLDSLKFDDLYQMSINDSESFWGTLAMQFIQWEVPFQKVCDCNMEEGLIRWFTDGKLNISGITVP